VIAASPLGDLYKFRGVGREGEIELERERERERVGFQGLK